MRKFLFLLIVSLSITNITISQNILQLKNGDKISGKLEEYKNDTVTFKLNGNFLKFHKSNIISVLFDALSVANNESIAPKESISERDSRISGVVTYYKVKEGILPDLGARVYIVDSVNLANINLPLIDSSVNINGPLASLYRQKVYKLNRPTVNDITSRASTEIKKFRGNKSKIEIVVDLSGKYTAKVKPGVYYILIESTRNGHSKFERMMGLKKIIIGENEEKYFNYDVSEKERYQLL